jgi:protein SCO1/2
VIIIVVALAACRARAVSPSPVIAPPTPPVAPVAAPAPPEPEIAYGASLYDLDEPLVDQHGDAIGADLFHGHPVLVSMFYGSCPAACPRLISDLVAIDDALDPATRADLRVLLVSFDPARDTPARLTEIAKQRGLDPSRFTLAAAEDDQARELSAALGIRWRRLSNGMYWHTSVITLLDRDGAIRARVAGLGIDPRPIVDALSR